MRWLSIAPCIERDDKHTLIVEESHLGRTSLWFILLLFTVPFPLVLAVLTQSTVGAVIGLVVAAVVLDLPFLFILVVSKYRRLEIRDGVQMTITLVYRFRLPHFTRVPWDAIDRVACEWAGGEYNGLILHLANGTKQFLLRGSYSEHFAAVLRCHLGDKFLNQA